MATPPPSIGRDDHPSILVMNNGCLGPGMSGGTRNMLDVVQEWVRTQNVRLMVPDVGEAVLPPAVPRVAYPSRFASGLVGIVSVYVQRFRQTCALAKKTPADFVVCSSSLLHDVLPGWVHRRRHGSRMAVFVYHIVPTRTSLNPARQLQFLLASLAQWLCLRLYRSADVIFSGNRLVHQELLERGIPAERMSIYYPAIDVRAIESANPIPRYDVLFIGRMVRRKGIFDLVDAVRGLNLRVGLVGDGEDRAALVEYAAEKGMADRVDAVGALPGDEMRGLLKGCRCFVFPSYEEGYGMALAEAIVADKPVVAYELPHYREAFGEGYIPVPLGDPRALAGRIKAVLDGDIDLEELAVKRRQVPINTASLAATTILERLTGLGQGEAGGIRD